MDEQIARFAFKVDSFSPVLRGDESGDVHEFVSNYKRAARLNGWNCEAVNLNAQAMSVHKVRLAVYQVREKCLLSILTGVFA